VRSLPLRRAPTLSGYLRRDWALSVEPRTIELVVKIQRLVPGPENERVRLRGLQFDPKRFFEGRTDASFIEF
jgi:hypothetical protein